MLQAGIPGFVAEIIDEWLGEFSDKKRSFVDIFQTLKQNDPRIMEGVDDKEVHTFVNWIEMRESSGKGE
jgi:hypothetical protein